MLGIIAPIVILSLIFASAAPDLARGGLRPCERLDQRICADLGTEGCGVWTQKLHRGGAASGEPHHWRRNRTFALDLAMHKLLGWDAAHADNPLCYDELDPAVYPQILAAVRTSVDAIARAGGH